MSDHANSERTKQQVSPKDSPNTKVSQDATPTTQQIVIGFYNLENLFDTQNDPNTLDDDFTPDGFKNWTPKRYQNKLRKLSDVIAHLGSTETQDAPSLLGVAEVENFKVLKDLINTKKLKEKNYGIVHYDSPDERGIDVGLLYRKDHFKIIDSKNIEVFVETEPGVRDRTRDILYVEGDLLGQRVYLLINHWPSRRDGAELTSHKRITVAQHNRAMISAITKENAKARIIIMGDFNDGPHAESVKNHLVKDDFYNPMQFLLTRYEGSLNHRFEWYLFDQIILSNSFMRLHSNPMQYVKAKIENDISLTEYNVKFKGNPFRTYGGRKYLGGYSDHFPVYCVLKIREA